MEQVIIESNASNSISLGYPDDLDITTYEDGRWRYAASFPDAAGAYREVYLTDNGEFGWSLGLFEHVPDPEVRGAILPRWNDGLVIDQDRFGKLSYETVRGSAEVWLRGGRIYGVA
jgi:hypothetical protein